MTTRASLLDIVHEHNTLNGFWFVLVEFAFVCLLMLGFAAMTARRGSMAWTFAGLGVAANAVAICVTVVRQMRRGERSSSIVRTYLGSARATIAREHPHLSRHTMMLTILVMMPFVLTVWLVVLRCLGPRRGAV